MDHGLRRRRPHRAGGERSASRTPPSGGVFAVTGWRGLQALHRWLYPPRCLLCEAPGQVIAGQPCDLCAACRADLARNASACERCAAPVARPGQCPRCQLKPPPFDAAVAPFLYQLPIDGLVKGFKFGGRRDYGRLLAQLFAAAVTEPAAQADYVVPVPLHPERERQRGFNQSLVLARALRGGAPVRATLLARVKPTAAQSGLTRPQRRGNVRNAFAVTDGELRGQSIMLVDDVLTSGSTVSAATQALKQAGAGVVTVAALARAKPPR